MKVVIKESKNERLKREKGFKRRRIKAAINTESGPSISLSNISPRRKNVNIKEALTTGILKPVMKA